MRIVAVVVCGAGGMHDDVGLVALVSEGAMD